MSVLNKDGNVTYPKLRDVNNYIEGNLYFKYYVRKKKKSINKLSFLPQKLEIKSKQNSTHTEGRKY